MADEQPELPEYFKAARAADEPFWKEQEGRIQGSLSQPCCTLSGISSGLITLKGNFAVVVHGEHECAGCFRHVGANSHNFFCTGLTEQDFVTGETAAPLDRCLRLVAGEIKPEAIFVLGACPVEVIGDRFEVVVDKVNADFPDIPMIAMHTSGLKVGSQAAMLDWMFAALASLPTKEPIDKQWQQRAHRAGLDMAYTTWNGEGDMMDWARQQVMDVPPRPKLDPKRCLNFLGLPSKNDTQLDTEVGRALEAAGLHIVANLPRRSSFDDWRAITFGEATFVADRSLYPKLVKVLEGKGQTVLDVPLPTGLDQTDEFYATIGERYGVKAELTAAVAEARDKAAARLEAFRSRYKGLRVAMGLRMLNNYQADQLAYQGLGDYRALAEMGFDLTIMVQGPPDRSDRIAKLFERRGITHPFVMFPEPWTLSDHIDGGRFDIGYFADHCRTQARKAGVPMIVSRDLDPYYEGVLPNIEHMDRMLRTKLDGGEA